MDKTTTLQGEMEEVLRQAPEQRHSYFQLKHFIVNKEPTHQAKLWQCLRELQSRHDAIESVKIEIEEANDRLAMIDIREERERIKKEEFVTLARNRLVGDLAAREREIKKRQYRRSKVACGRNLVKLKDKLAFLEQEARFFLECYKKLSEIEAVKDYDDLGAQTQYWNERLSQEVTLRSLLQLPLDAELAKTILALSDDIPIKERLVNSLKHVSQELSLLQVKYLEAMKEKNVQKKAIER